MKRGEVGLNWDSSEVLSARPVAVDEMPPTSPISPHVEADFDEIRTRVVSQSGEETNGDKDLPIGEFGAVRYEMIPLTAINILPQIRTEFDKVKLQELSDSIQELEYDEVAGVIKYNLMEALVEGMHTPESAATYLEDYNLINDSAYTLLDLQPYETVDGLCYIIHIAGERRYRASRLKVEQDGLSEHSRIICSIKDNPSYIDALPDQFIENNARVNPAPADEARAIRKYYDAMKKLDDRYTKVACAEKFAVNPDKITNSIIFTDYPECVQELVTRYPFTTVVDLKEIYDLWHTHYDEEGLPDEELGYTAEDGRSQFYTVEEVAAYEAETCVLRQKAELLRRRKDPGGPKRDASFKAQAEAIQLSFDQASIGVGQDSLLGMEAPETYWSRRKVAAGGLFEAAIQAVALLEMLNMLSREMKHRLGQLSVIDMLEVVALSSEDDAA